MSLSQTLQALFKAIARVFTSIPFVSVTATEEVFAADYLL
jgi:hypothetical protein